MKNLQASWQDETWRTRVKEWIRNSLAAQNIQMLSEPQETQVRPWSIVLNVMTDEGKVFFKAAPPDSQYEPPLTQKLAEWFPEQIPQVLAVESVEGWWLARDGGESIRAKLVETRDQTEWQHGVQVYADLQSKLTSRVEVLLALGVPDRRPHTLPAQYENLLNDTAILRIDQEKGITSEEYASLKALSVPLQEWCAQLESSRIPNSLHHGDLNSSNVLKRDGQYRFIDWGDASIAHPFSSLRTVLVSIEMALDLPDYDPATQPARDAYLAAWADYDTPANLFATFRLAQRLSSLVSTLSLYQGIVAMSDAERAEFEHIVPSLLQEFLHADLEKYPFVWERVSNGSRGGIIQETMLEPTLESPLSKQRTLWDDFYAGSQFFMQQGNIYETLRNLARELELAHLEYALIGGMALVAHGYRRFTEDVDILMTPETLEKFRERFLGRGYVPAFQGARKAFRDTETGVRIEVVTTGEYPGDGKPKPVAFPNPMNVRLTRDGIWLITLEKLIELKLASGLSAPHRLKDLSDVQELILRLNLPLEFEKELDPSVRAEYQRLWDAAQSARSE